MALRSKSDETARRVRHLIALDAWNVMKRLRKRQVEMVSLFSRMRDRGPLLGVIHSWFHSVVFSDLSSLQPDEQLAANQYYEVLGELRWYLQYTEDMPLQVSQKVTRFVKELETRHRRLTEVIGPPDAEGARVVDASVVHADLRPAVPVRSRRRRR